MSPTSIRPRWHAPIAVLCAPMPVLSSMYGADEPFRIVLVAGHLLGLVSATVWWRSSRRMRERIGVGVLLGWYLLPVAMRAVGMADGGGP